MTFGYMITVTILSGLSGFATGWLLCWIAERPVRRALDDVERKLKRIKDSGRQNELLKRLWSKRGGTVEANLEVLTKREADQMEKHLRELVEREARREE